METLIIEETNNILDVRLNRPQKHNAMNQQMIEELTEVFQTVHKRDIRGVLLSGVGKSFSAGADLEYMQSMVNFDFAENQKDSQKLYDMFVTIKNCPLPVTCKVQGNVMGGALGLVAVCDAVAALFDTRFCFSEVHLGLVPATISPFCCDRMSALAARELMLSGQVFTAQRALEVGLVSFVGRELEVDAYIKKTLESYLRAEPGAVAEAKKLIAFLEEGHSKASVRDTTTHLIAKLRVGEAGQARLRHFLEQRASKNEKDD